MYQSVKKNHCNECNVAKKFLNNAEILRQAQDDETRLRFFHAFAFARLVRMTAPATRKTAAREKPGRRFCSLCFNCLNCFDCFDFQLFRQRSNYFLFVVLCERMLQPEQPLQQPSQSPQPPLPFFLRMTEETITPITIAAAAIITKYSYHFMRFLPPSKKSIGATS